VLGLDDDADAFGSEVALQAFSHLRRQALLELQLAREQLHDARQLGEPDDPRVGQVGDVRDAVKRQQVVHAQRVKRDVADDHELVIGAVVGERRQRERLVRQKLRERAGDAARSVAQPVIGDIAAQRDQQIADRLFGSEEIDARKLLGLQHGVRVQRGNAAHV